MKVLRSELLSILGMLRPGLARKEFIAQACHFIFKDNRIFTFNDHICISHPFKSELEFSVKGDEFYKMLDGIQDETLTLTITDSNNLHIVSISTEAEMTTIVEEKDKVEHLILALIPDNIKWKPLPSDFTQGISMCSFSASKDLSSGLLACIYINDKTALSSDRYRISKYTFNKKIGQSFFILAKEAGELAKIPNLKEFYLTDNWVHFRSPQKTTFSCRLLEGEYPDVEKFFKVEDDSLTISAPPELKSVVENVTAFTDPFEEKSITIHICKGEIICEARRDIGWIKKKIKSKTKESGSFNISPIYLSQILSKSTNMTISSGKVLFVSDNFSHVLVLISKKD